MVLSGLRILQMSTRSFSIVRMLRDFIELDLRVGFLPSASTFTFSIRLKSHNIKLVFSLSSKLV